MTSGPAPGVSHILETALYTADQHAAGACYTRVFGFEPFFAGHRMGTPGVPGGGTSLSFRDAGGYLVEVATPALWPNV